MSPFILPSFCLHAPIEFSLGHFHNAAHGFRESGEFGIVGGLLHGEMIPQSKNLMPMLLALHLSSVYSWNHNSGIAEFGWSK